jgi:hypothetical protein
LLETVDTGETALTVPESWTFGSAASVAVAGWPTLTLVTSASANPATTSSCPRFVMVINGELDDVELDEDVVGELELAPPPPPPPAPEDELLEDELAVPEVDALLPPETDSPTEPTSAVTVPATGEVSVVSLTAF